MNATRTKPDSMTELINRNVKDVTTAYPQVGDLLGEFSIGCVNCSVASCLLKDVVGIHSLPTDQEQALFSRIAQVVFPGQAVAIPRVERREIRKPGAAKLSPPMHELVEEHRCIMRIIALIPKIVASLNAGLDAAKKQTIAEVLDFIRHFADRFHHAKEEEILFRYFDETADILAAMRKEHEIGRGHVRAAAAALERDDTAPIREHLPAYGALLTEHIRKEDEILYPWMDRELSDSQIGQLFSRFRAVDEQFGDKPASCRALVARLEARLA